MGDTYRSDRESSYSEEEMTKSFGIALFFGIVLFCLGGFYAVNSQLQQARQTDASNMTVDAQVQAQQDADMDRTLRNLEDSAAASRDIPLMRRVAEIKEDYKSAQNETDAYQKQVKWNKVVIKLNELKRDIKSQ